MKTMCLQSVKEREARAGAGAAAAGGGGKKRTGRGRRKGWTGRPGRVSEGRQRSRQACRLPLSHT
eukprot:527342-Hanusia_phi.AAC.2